MEDYHDNNSLRVEDVMLGGVFISSFISGLVLFWFLFLTFIYLLLDCIYAKGAVIIMKKIGYLM